MKSRTYDITTPREQVIQLSADEVPEFLNDVFATFGYDVLEEYFTKYERRTVALTIIGANARLADLQYAKGCKV